MIKLPIQTFQFGSDTWSILLTSFFCRFARVQFVLPDLCNLDYATFSNVPECELVVKSQMFVTLFC